MKVKLDENLGARGARLLRDAGHDVATVVEQAMTSASDIALIAACKAEDRCLVTMDLDFANPLRFDPSKHAGIAVLRPDGPVAVAELDALLETLAGALATDDIGGKLWIVERGRIREYTPDGDR